jgi:hypothetical protein
MKLPFKWGNKPKSHQLATRVMENCLSKEEADRLLEVDPQRLIDMDVAERITFLSAIFGDAKARFVNARLEAEIILPGQADGLMKWAEDMEDVAPKWRAEIKREILAVDKVLNEQEMRILLERLVKLKLGIGVTLEEAQRITELLRKADEAKARGSAEQYAQACQDMDDYIASITQSD